MSYPFNFIFFQRLPCLSIFTPISSFGVCFSFFSDFLFLFSSLMSPSFNRFSSGVFSFSLNFSFFKNILLTISCIYSYFKISSLFSFVRTILFFFRLLVLLSTFLLLSFFFFFYFFRRLLHSQ